MMMEQQAQQQQMQIRQQQAQQHLQMRQQQEQLQQQAQQQAQQRAAAQQIAAQQLAVASAAVQTPQKEESGSSGPEQAEATTNFVAAASTAAKKVAKQQAAKAVYQAPPKLKEGFFKTVPPTVEPKKEAEKVIDITQKVDTPTPKVGDRIHTKRGTERKKAGVCSRLIRNSNGFIVKLGVMYDESLTGLEEVVTWPHKEVTLIGTPIHNYANSALAPSPPATDSAADSLESQNLVAELEEKRKTLDKMAVSSKAKQTELTELKQKVVGLANEVGMNEKKVSEKVGIAIPSQPKKDDATGAAKSPAVFPSFSFSKKDDTPLPLPFYKLDSSPKVKPASNFWATKGSAHLIDAEKKKESPVPTNKKVKVEPKDGNLTISN